MMHTARHSIMFPSLCFSRFKAALRTRISLTFFPRVYLRLRRLLNTCVRAKWRGCNALQYRFVPVCICSKPLLNSHEWSLDQLRNKRKNTKRRRFSSSRSLWRMRRMWRGQPGKRSTGSQLQPLHPHQMNCSRYIIAVVTFMAKKESVWGSSLSRLTRCSLSPSWRRCA